MNLVVDIGNTLIKLGVMNRGECVAERSVEQLVPATLDELFACGPIGAAIVSSTRGEVSQIVAMLRARLGRVVEFTPATRVPIDNAYLTPETLGRDRLAAAVGAATLFPGRNVLVVDFGTAVTFDLVTADGTFRGGCISPGLRTRFRALHDYTARLPMCGPTGCEGLVGRSTREAVELGVVNSLTFEIEGYITRMGEKFDDLCVIFTGGDAKRFAKRIKNTIFANRNLVFCGLDRILEFHASEEHLP